MKTGIRRSKGCDPCGWRFCVLPSVEWPPPGSESCRMWRPDERFNYSSYFRGRIGSERLPSGFLAWPATNVNTRSVLSLTNRADSLQRNPIDDVGTLRFRSRSGTIRSDAKGQPAERRPELYNTAQQRRGFFPWTFTNSSRSSTLEFSFPGAQ